MTDTLNANHDLNAGEIEWVFFDYDGTLRHNDPDGLSTFHSFLEEHGVAISTSDRRQAFRWNHSYWANSKMLKQDRNEAGEEAEQIYIRYTRRYLKQLGIKGERLDELASRMHQMMAEHYNPIDHIPEEVPRTLSSLKDYGYSLALISNRHKPFHEQLAALDLVDYFEFTLAAGEVGWWKPDPRLLQHAARRAGIETGQAVYVGDNPFADVSGAKSAGLQPILIDPEQHFPEVECPVINRLDGLLALLRPSQI